MVIKRYTTVILAALLFCTPAAAAHSEELPAPRVMQSLSTGSDPKPLELPEVELVEMPPTHSFDVEAAIALAYSEVGTSRATGYNQEGECIMSVRRWVRHGGAPWTGGGTPRGNYFNATEHPVSEALPGDVIQFIHIGSPDSWLPGIHTVLVVGVNEDGTLGIVESNNPGGSGYVSSNDNWTPTPPAGFQAVAFRF